MPNLSNRQALTLTAMGFIFFAALLMTFAWFDRQNDLEFAQSAATAQGRVVQKRTATRTNKQEGRPDVFYYLTIAFTAGGAEHTFESGVSREEWEKLEKGDPIAVEYLPDNPERNRIRGSGGALGAYLTAALGGLFGLAGGGLLFAAVGRNARSR